MRTRDIPWQLCAIIGLGLATSAVAPACADDTFRTQTPSTHGDHTAVGWMTISTDRYDILDSKDVCSQLISAFQCAGYQAYRHGPNGSGTVGTHDQRAGFVEEGRLREDAWRQGRWVDRIVLSLLAGEWRDARK